MRQSEKIRLGVPTRKHIYEPEEEQQCLNCGASYHGAYCPHCGKDLRQLVAEVFGIY